MIIAINLINNTAQEVTTVVFAQGVNQKNMRQAKFVVLSVQSLKQSENCLVTI